MNGLNRRRFLAGTMLSGFFGSSMPALGRTASLPWRNWSGGVVAHPRGRFVPDDEAHLAAFLGDSSGAIRPVGSGHSFAPLVPTDGHIVVLDHMRGLIDHDPDKLTATFAAGTTLAETGPELERIGQAMYNLPDIDRQTLAGATATATHGTGADFGCLSSYITGMRLVNARGEIIDVDAEADAELFAAARVSMGALGIITRITMQNRTPYRLLQRSWVDKVEDLLEQFDDLTAQYRHFELFPYVHSNYAIALATEETDQPTHNPPPAPDDDAAFVGLIQQLSAVPPEHRLPILDEIAAASEPSERADVSYRILANVRNVRFNEMEYSVPKEAGAECLREILRTIIGKRIDVVFPLEYRYVRGDDTWLSMSSGEEDHAAISIHRAAQYDYRAYFDLIEPIFWKYGGRPHWGKIHSLGAAELSSLYPRFGDFQKLRAEMDPKGRLLNDHLRRVFGVSA